MEDYLKCYSRIYRKILHDFRFFMIMRLDLFYEGDSVLLVGEGNFSFAVALHKHQFSINITATSFEIEPKSEYEQQNIEYLRTNEVPVFFNVDATKLQDNPNFAGTKFSKIIFNFPHVGGKMKIHLNRELLRNFFKSAKYVLSERGLVLVSLCQGQGGTPADGRQRRWDDTWQITEMAAHGDFILTYVEPFLGENFLGYVCVGYRSRNVAFHLDGALVHIFCKKLPFEDIHRPQFIPLPGTDILTHSIYADLYIRNPNLSPDTAVSYLRKILIDCLSESEVEIIEKLPLYTQKHDGIQCEVNSITYSLRSDPAEILSAFHTLSSFHKRFTFYSGMYFRKSASDFLTNAPVDLKFTLLGKNVRSEIIKYLYTLIPIFGRDCTVIIDESALMYGNGKAGSEVKAAEFHEFRDMECCIIHAQTICEYLFNVKWREIWADHKISTDSIPRLKATLLYPSRYELDITLRYTKPFSDVDLMKVLWLEGGLIIEAVKLVNEYLCDKWSSKCYRISYRSLDRAMYRERVIRIHAMIGRTLEAALGVTIG